jgi:hypothetical protein
VGPLEQSPSNSFGKAGGGARLTSVRRARLERGTFGLGGGDVLRYCNRSCSNSWKPFTRCLICLCVSPYLASDSERACSGADIQLALIVEAGSSQEVEASGKYEEGSLVGKYTEYMESDNGLRTTLWWT